MIKNIDELLNDSIANKYFSGVSYAIGTSNKIIDSNILGNLYWGGPELDHSSLFDIASVTKPIAILPLMFTLEEGMISLDDTVDFFLESYKDTNKAKITLRQLLTHTSGIPGQQPLYKDCNTVGEFHLKLKKLALTCKPGSKVQYSSQGFMILGEIIESIEQKTLDVVLKERVFLPLKMENTLFNPNHSFASKCVATEDCKWRGEIVQGQVHDENAIILGGVAAHAGLFSNSKDLIKLLQTILLSHRQDLSYFLKKSTVNLMGRNHTPHLQLGRSLGWQSKDLVNSPAGDYFSLSSYGHTGFTGTSIWIDPENDIFAILLTNRVHPSRENTSIIRIRQIFHNLAYQKIKEKDVMS
ncbi:serine hydrolase domain-containing protein [Oceanobacillus jeddahense]|uniref:Beta-lactamase family protein n=1 Tax=Oceanobacillus jeddahense TaxID=1462527 RepID=A0ABY5JUL1_9BACI|nr:serine hydrolase domain-containing protein [Oceanobacillus jeddahense]UUI02259.1 beta-lactamase family protein [Oceanobacillus jeddahense]